MLPGSKPESSACSHYFFFCSQAVNCSSLNLKLDMATKSILGIVSDLSMLLVGKPKLGGELQALSQWAERQGLWGGTITSRITAEPLQAMWDFLPFTESIRTQVFETHRYWDPLAWGARPPGFDCTWTLGWCIFIYYYFIFCAADCPRCKGGKWLSN